MFIISEGLISLCFSLLHSFWSFCGLLGESWTPLNALSCLFLKDFDYGCKFMWWLHSWRLWLSKTRFVLFYSSERLKSFCSFIMNFSYPVHCFYCLCFDAILMYTPVTLCIIFCYRGVLKTFSDCSCSLDLSLVSLVLIDLTVRRTIFMIVFIGEFVFLLCGMLIMILQPYVWLYWL